MNRKDRTDRQDDGGKSRGTTLSVEVEYQSESWDEERRKTSRPVQPGRLGLRYEMEVESTRKTEGRGPRRGEIIVVT